MKVGSKGRYAVMALIDLATRDTTRPVALADIAARQDISLSYLEQLFGQLRKASLVKSVRGPGGGYLLGQRTDEIRIADIISAVETISNRSTCAPSTPSVCHGNEIRCLTHDLWYELGNHVAVFLNGITLEDVLTQRVGTLKVIEQDQLAAQ